MLPNMKLSVPFSISIVFFISKFLLVGNSIGKKKFNVLIESLCEFLCSSKWNFMSKWILKIEL